jgi:hypothetical protein
VRLAIADPPYLGRAVRWYGADWEFVLAQIPESRRGRSSGLATADVLTLGVAWRSGFVGSKPDGWTRWVLAVLGYDPDADELVDLFPGSGRVSDAAAGVLL